jgi:hypothetical protein
LSHVQPWCPSSTRRAAPVGLPDADSKSVFCSLTVLSWPRELIDNDKIHLRFVRAITMVDGIVRVRMFSVPRNTRCRGRSARRIPSRLQKFGASTAYSKRRLKPKPCFLNAASRSGIYLVMQVVHDVTPVITRAMSYTALRMLRLQ